MTARGKAKTHVVPRLGLHGAWGAGLRSAGGPQLDVERIDAQLLPFKAEIQDLRDQKPSSL